MNNKNIFVTVLLLLASCSQGTGVLPAGPDTYTATEYRAPILGGGSEAERAAMTEANDYCEHDSKNFYHLNMVNNPLYTQEGLCYVPLSRSTGSRTTETQFASNFVIENRNR
jgi:hypothetical protein